MFRIAPPPWAAITGNAARVAKNTASSATVKLAFQASVVIVAIGSALMRNALFTRMSRRPWRAGRSRTSFVSAVSSVTSQTWTSALPPRARIAAAVSRSDGSRSPLTTTCAPSAANAATIAAPIPVPEPVTSATLPSSLPICTDLRAAGAALELRRPGVSSGLAGTDAGRPSTVFAGST